MFSVTEMTDFTIFSITHVVTLILFTLACWLIIYFRKELKANQSTLKWTLFIILIVCEITMHLWLVLTNQWEIGNLPLQLCSLSTFLAIFLMFKKSQKVFHLLFFIGFIPPILSMITPDIIYNFPHYRFIKYFLHHSAIPLAVFYFILFEGYRVPRKAVVTSFLTLNVIAVPVFFLNMWLDTNFFFLANPSEQKTLLSFFGNGIWYYINLEIVAIIVFIITYLPMGYILKFEKEYKELRIEKP